MGRVGLTSPISTFLKQYPDGSVTIDIEKGATLKLMDDLMEGKIDMAFTPTSSLPFPTSPTLTPTRWISSGSIPWSRMSTMSSSIKSIGLRAGGQIQWKDLEQEKLVLLDKSFSLNAMVRDCFQRCGLHPNIAFECDQVDAILGMVEENFGISILSKRVATTCSDVVPVSLDAPSSGTPSLWCPRRWSTVSGWPPTSFTISCITTIFIELRPEKPAFLQNKPLKS